VVFEQDERVFYRSERALVRFAEALEPDRIVLRMLRAKLPRVRSPDFPLVRRLADPELTPGVHHVRTLQGSFGFHPVEKLLQRSPLSFDRTGVLTLNDVLERLDVHPNRVAQIAEMLLVGSLGTSQHGPILDLVTRMDLERRERLEAAGDL